MSMPPDRALEDDDDYVVSLLLKDAEANRKRYLTSGLGPLLSKRSNGNAPKPNTRFLKNIIRETDSHNAALKAKEEEESRARLKGLKGEKRRRDEEDTEGSVKRRRGDDKPGRWASVLGGLGESAGRRSGREVNGIEKDERGSRHHHRSRREHSFERRDTEKAQRSNKRSTHRSRSRSRSPRHRKERKRRSRSASRSRKRSTSPHARNGHTASKRDHKDKAEDSDSDPLDDLVGPRPPPKVHPRGRGANKSAFDTIEARFHPSYNPKTDVDLTPDDGERDDWDMALEAHRDRAKWRAKGAERLKDAGFTEDEVGRWESGGGGLLGNGDGSEKDVEDVRWRKKGEGREWDHGKVFDEEGGVSLKPEWGRLKGT